MTKIYIVKVQEPDGDFTEYEEGDIEKAEMIIDMLVKGSEVMHEPLYLEMLEYDLKTKVYETMTVVKM